MENQVANQITCPNCKKTISNNSIVNDAANAEGANTQFIVCDCGERITYWQITAQLRGQKTFGAKLQNWFRSLSQKRV